MNDDGHFGKEVASTYDEQTKDMSAPAVLAPTVDFLAALADNGKVLEFGIGTGRVALPLVKRGVPVHGIELSRAMVEKLTAKPDGADLPVFIGDFSKASTGEVYSVVYLVFNTIMNLTTQAEQVACFRNAATHLKPGGCFVIEVMIPRLQTLPHGQKYQTFDLSDQHWGIDEYNVSTQSLTSHHLLLSNGNASRFCTPSRYTWPAELDLMAQLAGMNLKERWGSWK